MLNPSFILLNAYFNSEVKSHFLIEALAKLLRQYQIHFINIFIAQQNFSSNYFFLNYTLCESVDKEVSLTKGLSSSR